MLLVVFETKFLDLGLFLKPFESALLWAKVKNCRHFCNFESLVTFFRIRLYSTTCPFFGSQQKTSGFSALFLTFIWWKFAPPSRKVFLFPKWDENTAAVKSCQKSLKYCCDIWKHQVPREILSKLLHHWPIDIIQVVMGKAMESFTKEQSKMWMHFLILTTWIMNPRFAVRKLKHFLSKWHATINYLDMLIFYTQREKQFSKKMEFLAYTEGYR